MPFVTMSEAHLIFVVRLQDRAEHSSYIEIDSNKDMEIRCNHFAGELNINQISATSKLYLPSKTDFLAVSKGLGNKIEDKIGGEIISKSTCRENNTQSDLMIELNGVKSKLIICTDKDH